MQWICYFMHVLFQNPTGHGLGQPAVADSTWAGELDQTISRDPFRPQLVCDLQLQVMAFISIQRLQLQVAHVFFQISAYE